MCHHARLLKPGLFQKGQEFFSSLGLPMCGGLNMFGPGGGGLGGIALRSWCDLVGGSTFKNNSRGGRCSSLDGVLAYHTQNPGLSPQTCTNWAWWYMPSSWHYGDGGRDGKTWIVVSYILSLRPAWIPSDPLSPDLPIPPSNPSMCLS